MTKINKNITTIHQFTPNMRAGDSLTNALIYTQKLLRELGFNSEIYLAKTHVDINLKHQFYHISQYNQDKTNILFYHHSTGHQYHEEIMQFQDKKILIYHNITPEFFFKHDLNAQKNCNLGREQLANSAKYFIGSFAPSKYNCKELKYYNYPNPTVLTILSDLNKQILYRPNEQLVQKYHNLYNIIFVGRVVSNKMQHQLIDIAYSLKKQGLKNFKIHIIGGNSQDSYMRFIKNYARKLDILREVTITGKVNNEDLVAYYKLADLYLSVSEHEGFGMPQIEAMKYDTPVLTYNTGGISTAVPKECLLEYKSPTYVAKKIIQFQKDPYLKVKLLKKQKRRLEKFSYENTKNKLIKYLNYTLKTNLQLQKIKKDKKVFYQIEGPFDTSYSLSIVNCNIALALQNYSQDNKVKLYSTEGGGDFKSNLTNLTPDIKALAVKKLPRVDISLRLLYPPRTNAMEGFHKIIGPYGWEESKFPSEYAEWFNTKLTMLFTMSDYVKKTLHYNGVYVPIVTTGIVVEKILKITSQPLKYPLPNGFKLLHISSCFPRKGLNILLKAFDTLNSTENISLVIKTFPNQHNNTQQLLSDLGFKETKKYEDSVVLYKKDIKSILLINKDLPLKQIKYLYENTNLLVAPSLGEGFGLPMAEAMLLNLPVLTTNYGGQTDFCTKETSWLIDFKFELAKTHMNQKNSVWAVPTIDSLKSKILEIKTQTQNSSKEYTHKLINAKKYILKNYSSKKVVKNIEKAIKTYPLQKTTQNIAIFTTYNVKCGIADYSKFLVSSFKEHTTILAPKETNILDKNEEKNVIRCWDYGRGTKSIDKLKSTIKNKNITRLIIQYNFGFLSLERLEELILFCNKNNIQIYLFFHSTEDIDINNEKISLKQIASSLKKVDFIYVHTLKDLNSLKNKNIYKNTYLFTHGFDTSLLQDVKPAKEIVLATFGFLLPQKGTLELIDILKRLHQKGIKAKLLFLNALYPAEVSKNLEKKLKQKIQKSGLEKYISLDTNYYSHKEIVYKLSQVTKIVYYYTSTKESSSASVRMGLLAQKEVITNPNKIFDDVYNLVTMSNDNTIDSMVNTIEKSLKTPYSKEKHKQQLFQNSWKSVSETFYHSLNQYN